MRDNIRKYILDVDSTIACGIGTSETITQYNLLNSFSIQSGADVISYSSITETNLLNLTSLEYEQRVTDFLTYANIDSLDYKNQLITGSTYFDPSCGNYCLLNTDFLVYPFLTGVRVVNVGSPLGILQYKAYPLGGDSANYNWQSYGTFLNLNMNMTYVFEVRDYLSGATNCSVSKTIVLSSLIPSTTKILQPKTVSFIVSSSNTTSSGATQNGYVSISPALTTGEEIDLNYEIGSLFSGIGCATAILSYMPNGSSTYSTYSCATNSISPQTNSILLHSGDKLCYDLDITALSLGSSGDSYVYMNSVNGCDTTIPAIDSSSSGVSIQYNIPQENIGINLVELNSYITPSLDFCTTNGYINFTPAIPVDESITLNLRSFADATLDGISSIYISCLTAGSTPPAIPFSIQTNTCPQPASGVSNSSVVVNYGDQIYYTLNGGICSNGSSGYAEIDVISAQSTSGLTTQLTTPIVDVVDITANYANVVLSLCSQTTTTCYDSGFLNINPSLSGSQYVTVDLSGALTVAEACPGSTAEVNVFCKAANNTSYVKIINEYIGVGSICLDTIYSCSFNIHPNDSICYNIYAVATAPLDVASASLSINTVCGYNGATASIDSSKCLVTVIDINKCLVSPI